MKDKQKISAFQLHFCASLFSFIHILFLLCTVDSFSNLRAQDYSVQSRYTSNHGIVEEQVPCQSGGEIRLRIAQIRPGSSSAASARFNQGDPLYKIDVENQSRKPKDINVKIKLTLPIDATVTAHSANHYYREADSLAWSVTVPPESDSVLYMSLSCGAVSQAGDPFVAVTAVDETGAIADTMLVIPAQASVSDHRAAGSVDSAMLGDIAANALHNQLATPLEISNGGTLQLLSLTPDAQSASSGSADLASAPFVPQIELSPSMAYVTDSIWVSVKFPVDIASWDIIVELPNGDIISDFADEFIVSNVPMKDVWYRIEQPFVYTRLTGESSADNIIFRVTATSADGGDGSAMQIATVQSSLALTPPNVVSPDAESIPIDFVVPSGYVEMNLYDVAGRYITNLIRDNYDAGLHTLNWDGITEKGQLIGSGVYLVTLQTTAGKTFKKMIVVR